MSDLPDIVERLRMRAEIRRGIQTRKSVQEGKPDRIADLLEEAAIEIECLRNDRIKFQAQTETALAGWENLIRMTRGK